MFYCADHRLILFSNSKNELEHKNCNTEYYGEYYGGSSRINDLLIKHTEGIKEAIYLNDKNAEELLEIKEIIEHIRI